MIMIHELGHFWAARFFDVKVEAFSFGFGPRLFGFRRGETDYRFSLILFGGYVKMAGEMEGVNMEGYANMSAPPAEGAEPDPRSLLAKPRWQRLIIAFAGPFMNMVLAVGLLTGLYMVKYQRVSDAGHGTRDRPRDGRFARGQGRNPGRRPDRQAGWQGQPDLGRRGIKEIAGAYRPMHLTIERNGKRFDTAVTPILSEALGVGYAGWDERGEIELDEVDPSHAGREGGPEERRPRTDRERPADPFPYQFQELTKNSGGKPLEIEYDRNGEKHEVWCSRCPAEATVRPTG